MTGGLGGEIKGETLLGNKNVLRNRRIRDGRERPRTPCPHAPRVRRGEDRRGTGPTGPRRDGVRKTGSTNLVPLSFTVRYLPRIQGPDRSYCDLCLCPCVHVCEYGWECTSV